MYKKRGYKKPQITVIDTENLCQYGCQSQAKYMFANGKLCCSKHQNSCLGKRKQFSDRTDHKDRAEKSLATRTKLGITKTSRIKANQTMIKNGTYQILREKMQEYWKNNHHQNNPHCLLLPYKTLDLKYQGSHEYNFLLKLEMLHGLDWIAHHVRRGPSVWYIDTTGTKRLYISDFLIDNIIYEIKSYWTWNRHGADMDLENNNKAKLNECLKQGYKVMLVLDGEEIIYA